MQPKALQSSSFKSSLCVYHATSSLSSLNVCDAREIGIVVTQKRHVDDILAKAKKMAI